MSRVEEYYREGAAEFELRIHRELECPNWFKIQYPELFADQAHLDSIKQEARE